MSKTDKVTSALVLLILCQRRGGSSLALATCILSSRLQLALRIACDEQCLGQCVKRPWLCLSWRPVFFSGSQGANCASAPNERKMLHLIQMMMNKIVQKSNHENQKKCTWHFPATAAVLKIVQDVAVRLSHIESSMAKPAKAANLLVNVSHIVYILHGLECWRLCSLACCNQERLSSLPLIFYTHRNKLIWTGCGILQALPGE